MLCHMRRLASVDTIPDEDQVTIDGLAQATGVTVRNIRAYQARGLLPPPDVRARTGYYGAEHRARLELIQDLQGEGLKLDSIKRLFEVTGGKTEQVLEFTRAVRELFSNGSGQIVSPAELQERFGSADEVVLKRAVKAGLLRKVAEDQYEETTPGMLEAAERCTQLGIPIDRAVNVAEQVRRHAEAIAKIYVQLFLDEIWKPFDNEGRPEDQWPRLHESLRQLRDASSDALVALLDLTVADRLAHSFGRDITRTVRATAKQPSASGPS